MATRRPPAKKISNKQQREWYEENMRVKRGELVWSWDVNKDRFGARGGYITVEEAERLEAERLERIRED